MTAIRRLIDLLIAAAALVVATPVLIAIAAWLRIAGTRKVIHSEQRVGRHGRLFRIHKFRSLREGSPTHPSVAAADDPRISAPGRFLRPWRLDELPQLYDVLVGHMSLVGPRPQRPENLEALPAATRELLQCHRPGITGPAAIEFLAEDEALAGVDDPAFVYRWVILPEKVRLELDHLARRSLGGDLRILLLTAARVFSRRARRSSLARIRALIERGLAAHHAAAPAPSTRSGGAGA